MRSPHVFGVAVTLALLAGCQSPPSAHDEPPAARASSQPAVPPSSAPPAAAAQPPLAGVLGPRGFGALKLGMTVNQATATGELTDIQRDNCWSARLRGSTAHADAVNVYISKAHGVVAIFLSERSVRTPEGIGTGSTLAQAKRAYPHLSGPSESTDGFAVAPVPGHPSAHYQFEPGTSGAITAIALITDNQDCFD